MQIAANLTPAPDQTVTAPAMVKVTLHAVVTRAATGLSEVIESDEFLPLTPELRAALAAQGMVFR